MGRKSIKPNKNIYQLSREEAELTRAQASLMTQFMSESVIEKIENGVIPDPDEVVAMADAYRKPELCNYYCNKECAIGKVYVPERFLNSYINAYH